MNKNIMILIFICSLFSHALAADLNIITDRSDFHLTEIVKTFEQNTGKSVDLFFVKEGIIEKAQSGKYDIMISKDSSDVVAAKEIGMLKRLPSSINKEISKNFIDKDQTWFLMSYRIRAFHVKSSITDAPLSYEDLAKPQYKGRICNRSLTHNYNLELFGILLSDWGEEKFTNWLKDFNNNLAKIPAGNDRSQVQDVFNGICDIAIANTYYRGVMLSDPNQKAWAEATTVIIPNQGQDDSGAIPLYAGVGTLTNNILIADFYRYILSNNVQKSLSLNNFEYPLVLGNVSDAVNNYGVEQGLKATTIKMHKNNQNELFELRKQAYKIIKTNL